MCEFLHLTLPVPVCEREGVEMGRGGGGGVLWGK